MMVSKRKLLFQDAIFRFKLWEGVLLVVEFSFETDGNRQRYFLQGTSCIPPIVPGAEDKKMPKGKRNKTSEPPNINQT